MKCILIILLATILTDALCQSISGRIVDASNGRPIAYANVRVVRKNIGTVTTKDGVFQLSLSNSNTGDTIKISCIGYETLSLPAGVFNATNSQTVKLKQQTLILDEVVINEKNETQS